MAGVVQRPLYHATRNGPSVMQHGLLSPFQQEKQVGSTVTGLGLSMGNPQFVSLTPFLQSGQRIAALFQALNEALAAPSKVVEWWELNYGSLCPEDWEWALAQHRGWRDKGGSSAAGLLVDFINALTRCTDDMTGVSPSLSEAFYIPPDFIGVVTAYLHVDALVPRADSPICRTGRNENWAETIPYQMDEEEWLEYYGLPKGTSFAVARGGGRTLDAGEVRACPEDLTAVAFSPVLDWRNILDPQFTTMER